MNETSTASAGGSTLLPGMPREPAILQPWARMLAQLITEANSVNPSSWCLTLDQRRRYVTLNVGRIFVNRTWADRLLLVVSERILQEQPDLAQILREPGEPAEFATLPGYTWRIAKFRDAASTWDRVKEDALSAVRAAAENCRRTPYARAHSEEAVTRIEEILGEPLPRPRHATAEPTGSRLWVVRAGEEGQAHEQFVGESVIAIGWNELGDLSAVKDIADLKARYAEVYPDKSRQHVSISVSEIQQFLRDVQPGDAVLYPIKGSDSVLLGEVSGTAAHNPSGTYTMIRPTRWNRTFSRQHLPGELEEGALARPLTIYEVPKPSAGFWRAFEEARLHRLVADNFVMLVGQEGHAANKLSVEVNNDANRIDALALFRSAGHVNREELLAFLKGTNWYRGAKATTAPEVTETQEKADRLLAAILSATQSVPSDPQDLRNMEKELPTGFGVGFLTEMLAYSHPDACWEYNGPIEQAAERLGFESWSSLPHGDKNEFGRYFALRPLMESLRDALGFAGVTKPTFLDVDKLLWMIATEPDVFPMLPMRIDKDALDALIVDLRSWHPDFTRFDDTESNWWANEREYKQHLLQLFQEQLLDGILDSDGGLDWALEVIARVYRVLTKSLPTGIVQNLLSWRFWEFLKPLRANEENAHRFALGFRTLLVGEDATENRLDEFNQSFIEVLEALGRKANPAFTRSFPTLFLMLQDPANEFFIRTTEFNDVFKALTGRTFFSDGLMNAGEYERARAAARALFEELTDRGFRPLDLMDVQSFLHVVSSRNTWILQANPSIWDIARFLDDGHRQVAWSLPKMASEFQENDTVYFWASGEGRGVVAQGATASEALSREEVPAEVWEIDRQYYADPELGPNADKFALIDIERAFPEERISAEHLKEHPVLKDLTILKQPSGTVYRVNKSQAVALYQLTHSRTTNGERGVTFQTILDGLKRRGLHFPDELVANYLLALQTKRFAILTGISGTGKTKLAMEVARAFPASWSAKAAIEVPEGALVLAVQPYTLKYGNLVVPVELSRGIDWEAMTSDEGRHRIPVQFGGQVLGLNFWRDATRDVTVLTLRGEFKKWFHVTFAEGDEFMLEGLEDDEGRVTRLSISKPAQVTTTRAIENCEVVAVRPDWTDHRGLLGYFNPLTGRYVRTPFLELVMRAANEVTRAGEEDRQAAPFFTVLDEMNLARVEHYFSDLLSCMESDEPVHLHDDDKVEAGETEDGRAVPKKLRIPPNLFVVGTVNVDETTYMFSPKVLDRAFTIELNEVDLAGYAGQSTIEAQTPLELSGFTGLAGEWPKPDANHWKALGSLDSGKLRGWLLQLNEILEREGRHFGYRVANEIARFVTLANEQTSGSPDALRAAFDLAVLEKVLPKLNGTQQELHEPIRRLFGFALDPDGTVARDPDDLTPVDGGYGRKKAEALKTDTQNESSEEEQGSVIPALPRAARKLWRMARRLRQRGFVSYIE